MKHLFILFSIVLSMICFSSFAQSSATPKYGVVDMDSVLLTIPELKILEQKIDSVQEAMKITAEPLAVEYQNKIEILQQLQFSGDPIAMKSTQDDAQLLYQELNLLEQKARRAVVPFQQEASAFIDKTTKQIQSIGEKLDLTFIMPKTKYPVYLSFGAPMIFESPLYYSGEAIDITVLVIQELHKQNVIQSSDKKTNNKLK